MKVMIGQAWQFLRHIFTIVFVRNFRMNTLGYLPLTQRFMKSNVPYVCIMNHLSGNWGATRGLIMLIKSMPRKQMPLSNSFQNRE